MVKKLSVAEKFYVENNPKGLTLEQLSEELEKPVSAVKPFYVEKSLKDNKTYTEIEPVHPGSKHNPNEKNYNVTIMAEHISQAADASRPERVGRTTELMKTCVHQCRRKSK